MLKTIFILEICWAICSAATISKSAEKLEIFRDDIAQVGSALENFTFDILETIIRKNDGKNEDKSSSNEEETTTVRSANGNFWETTTNSPLIQRIKRATADDDLVSLCKKYNKCQINPTQIEDLRLEVLKLQEIVTLIKNQQDFIQSLNKTSQQQVTSTTQRNIVQNNNVPTKVTTSAELDFIHVSLRDAIKSLNETRRILDAQMERDRLLEKDVKNQRREIEGLKLVVRTILARNNANDSNVVVGAKLPNLNTTTTPLNRARASADDFREIRKFLNKKQPKELDTTLEVNESKEIETKIQEIEKKLQRKNLNKKLKALERQLTSQEVEENKEENDIMRKLEKLFSKQEGKGGNDDIDDLDDLQDAIDKLRPKAQDDSLQIQAILTKLIQNQRRPQNSQFGIRKKVQVAPAPQAAPQYFCPPPPAVVQPQPAATFSPQPIYSRPVANVYQAPPQQQPQQQLSQTDFFPDLPQPNYYAEGNSNGVGGEKSLNYQQEIGTNQQKYQDDLRNEIDGLQTAIDGLNRPEYIQRPEDKAMIDDLSRQINDLRGIVNNLNTGSGGGYAARSKRSVNDNEIDEADQIVSKMTNFMGKLLGNGSENKNNDGVSGNIDVIQTKINNLKNQLGQSDNNLRASYDYFNDNNDNYYQQPKFSFPQNSIKKQVKTDIFVQIVAKIMDKIVASIPVVLQKIFFFGLDDLKSVDYRDYEIQGIFKNLGLFGWLPVILIKHLRGISYFLSILKKNNLFKNLLLPVTIFGVVFFAIFFLMWWLQPEMNNYKQIDYNKPNYASNNNNYKPSDNNYKPEYENGYQ